MNGEEKHDASEPKDPQPTDREPEPEPKQQSPDLGLNEERTPASADIASPEIVEAADQQPEVEAIPLSPVEQEPPTAEPAPAAVTEAISAEKPKGFFEERASQGDRSSAADPAPSDPARCPAFRGGGDSGAGRCWLSSAARYARAYGCASRHALSRERVVLEPGSADRR